MNSNADDKRRRSRSPRNQLAIRQPSTNFAPMPDIDSSAITQFLQDLHEDNANRALHNDKRVYMGNLKTPEGLKEILSKAMQRLGMVMAEGDPVEQVTTGHDFVFVEFRSVEEANMALFLDGYKFAA